MFMEMLNLLDQMASACVMITLTMVPVSAILFDRKQKKQLKKLSPYTGKIIVSSNFISNKMNSLEMEKIEFTKKRVLKPYVLKLCHYVYPEDLKIISNNIKTVSIKRKPLLFPYGIGVAGVYIPKENKILITSKDSLGHEFLHFASSIYDSKRDITLSGFFHSRKNSWIGNGINEGYTELLASRIYQKGDIRGYDNLVRIVQMIEMFFQNPQDMAHLYFSCNLPGLVDYLGQYIPTKEVLELIADLDYINFQDRMISPFGFIRSVQVQIKLYDWYKKSYKDQEKLKQFEELACKNKIVSLLIKRKKMKLYRKPPFTFFSQTIQTPKKNQPTDKIENLKIQKAILKKEREMLKNNDASISQAKKR